MTQFRCGNLSRLINEETTPILFSRNPICFSNARVADDFRWATDIGKAEFIQELSIRACSDFQRDLDLWMEYIAKKRFSLGDDIPNLKRMNIQLGGYFRRRDVDFCNLLGQHVRRLDWVHLANLDTAIDDGEMLDCLKQIVEKPEDTGTCQKIVLLEITKHSVVKDYFIRYPSTWKHATLWLGSPIAKSPRRPRFSMTQQYEVQKHRLGYDYDSSSTYLVQHDAKTPQFSPDEHDGLRP